MVYCVKTRLRFRQVACGGMFAALRDKLKGKGGIELKKKQETKLTPLIPAYPPWNLPYDPLGGVVVDPLGSYTGRPINDGELPVQDADDL